jgi:hypothetical protein
MINLPEISNIVNNKESSKNNITTKKLKTTYDYFSVRIPKNCIEQIIKSIKDERFLFFIKYGILRRYEGECDIIYIEIPQIPKKLVIYRTPHCRMKSLTKLNLSQRDLPHIPLFEGEDNLKYLSLELNRITKIDKLISLNNLIYLNLYGNYISEIENLVNINKLKFLLLGKNNIEQIKNLNALTDLEVLDLHSNKIKNIENIFYLKKLKVLNLANNQISSFNELVFNKNLEELNLRKNLIECIPILDDFQMIKKLNLGKNLIKKLDFLKEFQKLKLLQELILEENPVLNSPEAPQFVKNLPLKGTLKNISNLYPKTPLVNAMKKSGEIISLESFKSFVIINSEAKYNNQRKVNKSTSMNTKITESKSQTQSHMISQQNKNKYEFLTNLRKHKDNTNRTTHGHECVLAKESNSVNSLNKINKGNNMLNSPLNQSKIISSKSIYRNVDLKQAKSFDLYNKLIPIKQQWYSEMNNIISKGYNGYLHKKYKEININNGHIEVENEEGLYLYGNCLKVLSQKMYQEEIKTLSFNYFCYDFIMSKKILEYIKNFKHLINIKFSNNNIYSFYQLIKLEKLENIQKLSITDNEVCNSNLLKYFIFYRLNNLQYFNNKLILEIEFDISRKIFQFFDELISIKEKNESQKDKVNEENNESQDSINDYSDINDDEAKMEFFNYTKNNLSVCIEELIRDEEFISEK